MSNDSHSKNPDASDADAASNELSGEKITVPPPALYGETVSEAESDVEEATLLARIPEELIESIRSEERESGDRVSVTGGEGGLKQMFSREPVPIRSSTPAAEEGDALLDMLFEDQRTEVEDDGVVTSAPALTSDRDARRPPPAPPRPAPARPPPPLRARPATPPRPGHSPEAAPASNPVIPPPAPAPRFTRATPSPAKAVEPPPEEPVEVGDRKTPVPDGGDAPFEFAEPDDSATEVLEAPEVEAPAEVDAGELIAEAEPEPEAIEAVEAVEPAADVRDSAAEAAPPAAEAAEPWEDAGDLVEESVEAVPSELSAALPAEALEPAPAPLAVPLPSLPPPAAVFDNEQDASATLVQSHMRDAWAERATWLRAEAEALDDAAARARALLTVAELYVMAGEDATARAVAAEARELAPSLIFAHRLHRGLLMREGDRTEALEALDAETRVLGAPAARCHNTLVGAEIARVALEDAEGAHRRVEQAVRTHPSDPRAHVQRFCEALAAAPPEGDVPAAIVRFRLPDAAELAPLAAACVQVASHRGAPSRPRVAPSTPYEALLRARTLLAGGDLPGALAALEPIRGTSLGGGGSWLSASLAASHKETRKLAVAALRQVVSGSHGALARRALAARAIELGDAEAAQAATADAGGAFTAADRVALSALSGGARADVETWIDVLVTDLDLAPIGAAAAAALSDPAVSGPPAPAVGGIRARVATTLGRSLSRDALLAEGTLDACEPFSRAVVAHSDLSPESPLLRALMLELDLEGERGGRVARAVAALREGDGDRDGALAGAILCEVAGEPERAIAELDRARSADPQHEGAARARASHAEGAAAAQILAEHAQTLEEGPRAAVLLTEVGIRLLDAEEMEQSEGVLARAAELDPKLPIALHLGERSARARVDREGLIEWLRLRREAATDPLEQAHDLVREALLIAESDASSAAALLETALRSRPEDAGLRELFERLAPEPPEDRATWRAERAAESKGVEAARLALEAALEHERSGDIEQAAVCARLAMAAGDTAMAPIAQYRAALAGHGAGELIDALIPVARETTDLIDRREIYERLAELDELGRKDAGSGLLWRRSILEDAPGHLPTLRYVASALVSEGRDEELEPIALEIARVLEGPEATAHALLSARLRLRALPWEETREPVDIAYRNEPRGIWALRQTAAHARIRSEHALAIEADRQLIERTDRPSEAAALSVRAAKEALLAGSIEDAVAFFRHAITLVPQYLVAHLDLADALERGEDMAGAAEALEAAATASINSGMRAHSLYRAAVLWQDKVRDVGRAREVLEAVSTLDPSYADVFPRLQAIYIAEGARAELAALLERRLDAVTDPGERVEMEVLRGRALADVGDSAAAKQALAAALDANPDHVDALSAFADVCAGEEDWTGAEQAWIRLARLVPDAERQVAIYMRLGSLYDEHLPNPERAELAYQEILKRSPTDAGARERLVGLYKRAGDGARALEQQTILINAAETPEDKCRRTAELAEIYEATGDAKKAEATLLQARKTWPKDEFALGALARFYQRTDQAPAANVLLDRALADARRALNTGRFEPYLFSTLAMVADLRGRPGAARLSRAAVAALEGREATMTGAGAAAGDIDLDETISPDVMTPAFRELLRKTARMLDDAVPFDLDSIRATPLPPQQAELAELAHSVGVAYGLPGLQVHVTAALGAVCVPASSSPPTVVLGQSLVASPRDDVRLFLLHRAVKILQTNGGAFSRTAPIDLWPLLAAYLKALNPTWAPQGVDAARLTDAYGRMSRALPADLDPQASTLAADVIGTIGNRASTLNTVINGWGNRAALLALGDLNVALTGIAWSGGHTNAPPPEGRERVTWIGRNAEARDLIVFAVSDSLADARVRAGLDE